ncbi:hypothetical protein [Lentzea sp. E54]
MDTNSKLRPWYIDRIECPDRTGREPAHDEEECGLCFGSGELDER